MTFGYSIHDNNWSDIVNSFDFRVTVLRHFDLKFGVVKMRGREIDGYEDYEVS